MTKVVIFDFDGTIADSFGLFVKTLHKLLGKSGLLSQESITQLRGKQIKEITAQLGIKSWQLPKFVIEGRREIGNHFTEVSVFKDMPELIEQLSANGNELFILSTNSEAVISEFLRSNKLDGYFKQIYADIGLTCKAQSLRKLMKEHQYIQADSIYIGDEIRDIEAAHKVNIKCISVAWGYSTLDSLAAHNPDYLVANVSEILAILDDERPKLID